MAKEKEKYPIDDPLWADQESMFAKLRRADTGPLSKEAEQLLAPLMKVGSGILAKIRLIAGELYKRFHECLNQSLHNALDWPPGFPAYVRDLILDLTGEDLTFRDIKTMASGQMFQLTRHHVAYIIHMTLCLSPEDQTTVDLIAQLHVLNSRFQIMNLELAGMANALGVECNPPDVHLCPDWW